MEAHTDGLKGHNIECSAVGALVVEAANVGTQASDTRNACLLAPGPWILEAVLYAVRSHGCQNTENQFGEEGPSLATPQANFFKTIVFSAAAAFIGG